MSLRNRLLVAAGAAFACVASAAPVLALHAQAQAAQATVRVGDVAELRGVSADEREQLARVVLAPAPRVGQESVIGRHQVLAALPDGWTGEGASAVVVRRAVQVVDVPALCAAALAAAQERLASLGPAVSAQARCRADERAPVVLPAGALSLHADAARLRLVDGPQRLDVDIGVDGRAERAVPVALELSLLARQWCARAPLAEGTEVAADAFAECRLPVRREAQLAAAGSPLPPGWLRRALRGQEALAPADVVPVGAALAGDAVTVRLRSGMFALESSGALVQDARVGDRVRVRIGRTGEPVVGRLERSGYVELEERE